MSCLRAPTLMLALAAAVGLLLISAGSALGHGDEGEALAKTPARALVQQALGLLEQAGEPVEAAERLEAAIESKDSDGVALPPLREALEALEQGDAQAAAARIKEALAPADAPGGSGGGAAEGGEADGGGGPPTSAEDSTAADGQALAHTEEFEPDRGTEEWIGLALGVIALLSGVALLLGGHRRPAA